MNHNIIAIDFDDTLALNTNPGKHGDPDEMFEGSEPNYPLINKMHDLHNKGYRFVIFTARGMLSCKTKERAEEKYKKILEKWLHKYNVPYEYIEFGKMFAKLYVDDKAVHPKDFIKMDGL